MKMGESKEGVSGRSGLNAAEQAAVARLVACCEQHEGLELPLYLEPPRADAPRIRVPTGPRGPGQAASRHALTRSPREL